MLFTKSIVQAAAALVLLSLNIEAAHVSSRATVCNGYSEFCGRSLGNITMVGTHDSYAVGVNNLATNQDYDITQQLTDGVRMLQSQAHNNSGTIELCHTSCGLQDGGSLQDYLTKVVVLLIVNIDDMPATAFAPVFEAANVSGISYQPGVSSMPASSWPTLGSLIDNGTRLITFLDNHADITTVPYLLDEFSNIWETSFDLTSQTAFDCTVNRSNGDTSTQMFLINHFLDQLILGQPVPDPSQANETNAVSGTGSLGAQVATCQSTMGRPPTFMLVDFYEYGNGSVFEVAAAANGVTYNAKAIATPITSSSSGSSSGSSSSSSNHAQALLDVPSMTLLRVAPVMIISGILFAWNLF
ncbi:PLC-like phosphodiesterase [Rhodocollybia butyracea]|uniref:PLC-like phosphodiesterase n=1 Tax=Rhodocollybia butyracea TaxID=206335 RepID=A0A9P5UEB3_9AGAR|nr:PLC-like phosphodiesterase [Rhodocollybia butyracea]